MSRRNDPSTDPHDTRDDGSPSPSRRRWFAGLAALGGVGVLGAAAAHAQGWGRGRLDPEERARRMEWRIGRLVQDVGGSPQQKDQLLAIARAAVADLQPLREQSRELRRQGMALLSATVIDRAALERLRASRMQLEDARSRRMVQAFADAADVLTPEQRQKAAEQLRSRRGLR